MALSKPRLNWDQLLDGSTYVLDLDEIGWPSGLADFRAKVHYEVDRRRGIAHTRKLNPRTVEFYAEHATVRTPEGPCSCGAKVWELHVITCTSLGHRAATVIGGRKPAPALPPDPWAYRQPPAPAPRPAPTSEPVPAPRPVVVSAGITPPGEVPMWPAYGTWPPLPEGEEPRFFTTEEELEAWEEEVEVLRREAFAAASVDIEPLTPVDEEALLGPCTCGQDPVCLPECARAGG